MKPIRPTNPSSQPGAPLTIGPRSVAVSARSTGPDGPNAPSSHNQLQLSFASPAAPSYNGSMVTAQEKSLSFNIDPIEDRMDTQCSLQRSTTPTPTAVNRISNYDFIAHRFQEPPIGTSTKLRYSNLLGIRQQPRKYTGEIVVHLRRSHRATETSLYRGYFVPRAIDPSGNVIRHFKPQDMSEIETMPYSTPVVPPKMYGWGRTVPVVYEFECYCQCANYSTCKYDLRCAVTSYLRIEIAKKKIPNETHDAYGYPVNFGGSLLLTYGHEQRHVQSLTYWAENVAKTAEWAESKHTDTTWSDCQLGKKAFAAWASETMKRAIEKNENHKVGWDAFIPVGSRPYEQLKSGWTPKLDKTYPGTPPNPPIFPRGDVPCIGPSRI